MSGVKFEPLRSLARNAQRRHMEMQCDPSWVLDVFAERDTLRAEVDQLRGLLKECRPAVAGEVAKWQRLAVMGGHRGGELASGLLQRIDAALEVSA